MFGTGIAFGFQRLAADEVTRLRLPADGPAQTGDQRADGFVHIGSVEVHPGFQPQGVAAAQPAGLYAGFCQRLPERGGLGIRQHDLETILTRVAGTGDKPVIHFRTVEQAQRINNVMLSGVKQRQGLFTRVRPLYGDHGQLRLLDHLHIESFRLRRDPRQVLFTRRGIHHQAEIVFGQKVNNQVVQHTALFIEQTAVQGLAGILQLVDVVGQQIAQKITTLFTVQIDDGHVRHVEHARIATYGVVLFELRTIVDRHIPAGKIHQLGAHGLV